MEADFFAILNLPPGRYEKQAIDRQYRSVQRQILRCGGPERQRRLDDAFIARCVLGNAGQQAALLRRHLAAVRRQMSRPAMIAVPRPRPVRPPARPRPIADMAEAHAQFAQQVAEQMEDGLLRFTARLRLLDAAAKLGIAAFKANLIIAEVLHEQQTGNAKFEIRHKSQAPDSKPRGQERGSSPRVEHYGLRLLIALALAAAGGIALTAWLVG
jgi:hypothetical protein